MSAFSWTEHPASFCGWARRIIAPPNDWRFTSKLRLIGCRVPAFVGRNRREGETRLAEFSVGRTLTSLNSADWSGRIADGRAHGIGRIYILHCG